MFVSHASLKNFRNFSNLRLDLRQGVNILCGPNAQGKTNFLEALYFGATGRSRRTSFEKELISFHAQESYMQLAVEKHGVTDRIDVHLRKDGPKGFAINGTPIRRLGDLFGALLVVMFSPEDLQLVKNGPAERRRFYDMELCQLSQVYYYNIQQYYKVLKQRNALLKRLQKNRDASLADSLSSWDEQLAAYGGKIIRHRMAFTEKISAFANQIHQSMTDGKEQLTVLYKPNTTAEEFSDKLRRNAERDMLLGATSVGIHKDDAAFQINDLDARVFGSQGQQRTVSLSLKLAEIELIKEDKAETPVLLLDDVFSELDASRQACLLSSIAGVQTILTCTGVEDILRAYGQKCETTLYTVQKGEIWLANVEKSEEKA